MSSINKQLRERFDGLCKELEAKQGSIECVPALTAAIKDLTISLAIAAERNL